MGIAILLVDDEEIALLAQKKLLSNLGYDIITKTSAEEALAYLKTNQVNLVVSDLSMPGMNGVELMNEAHSFQPSLPFIVLTARASVASAVDAMRKGAFDYLEKPLDPATIDVILRRALDFARVSTENELLREHYSERYSFQNIVTQSPVMRQALEQASQITSSPLTTVSLCGESGVGKEVLARAIHFGSGGLPNNFVGVNCAAIPEALLESELFGHVKGAFTGAERDRDGKFSLAGGGTILLDEIGDMPLPLQAKLLRIIEERCYEKTGSNKLIPVDFRIIAATHHNLAEKVKQGLFREDLYYRINVIPIVIPPLRKRKEDIPILIDHFMELFRKHHGKSLPGVSQQTLKTLIAYEWPGNVRELRNILEYAAIMVRDELIQPYHLRLVANDNSAGTIQPEQGAISCNVKIPIAGLRLSEIVDDFTAKVLDQVLESCEGNKTKAAEILQVNRKIFYR